MAVKTEETKQFDPSAPPPFKVADIRAAIPDHCWIKNPWRSLSYVLRDILVILSLAAISVWYRTSSWVWPVYWVAQGTMFWAIFVLGHDWYYMHYLLVLCAGIVVPSVFTILDLKSWFFSGHGSFSDNPNLNNIVGHILHSSILVPYHGWRISHRTHHQNHGHVENDESWVPTYTALDAPTKLLRFEVPLPLFAYPLYLWKRSPGKSGSHFNQYSDMFPPNERRYIVTSTLCWTLMVANLIYLSTVIGLTLLFKLYIIPYLIFVMWLDFVTYLHHHGHEQKLPWYRGNEWSYLRGGLTTVDRDYGIFNNIHHDIGTHVIHHLFPQIPHYHLVEATKSAKPVLGKYYREPKKSGPIPVHLIDNLVRSIQQDHYVSDSGDIVYYQTDYRMIGKKIE